METVSQSKNQRSQEQQMLFSDALEHVVSHFPKRSQEIIFSRYGVFGSSPLTLEEIGKKYSITRERVRQVIREVLRKVREKKSDALFSQVREQLLLVLGENDGIMEEKQILAALGKDNNSEQAAVGFFLECMDSVVNCEIKGELEFSYALPEFSIESWRQVKNAALAVLNAQKRPLSAQELFDLMKKDQDVVADAKTLVHFLEVSQEIKKNSFNKWGVAKWKEISPKGTREKAYLVLKESGKPLHFREIAKKIDQFQLNKKKTHPQTVHNELIKDKSFVLVGRGIYALVEWGYKKGTVKDVIEEILKKSQALNRDEILRKVLEIRQVKKSTIVINLNNYFVKAPNGTYSTKK